MDLREELPRPHHRRIRDGAATGMLNGRVGMDDRRFLVFCRAGGSVTIVEHGEVTGDGEDVTLPPLSVEAGGEKDDSKV